MTIELMSPAFDPEAAIPVRHTCDGDDLSPPLEWDAVPEATRSLALICDDPDAPVGTWVHWLIYRIPASVDALPEGVPAEQTLESGARQGRNDFRNIGYGGPCPPAGDPHRYFFKLYALDVELDLKPGASKEQLLSAMEPHILDEGQLMGTYRRKGG